MASYILCYNSTKAESLIGGVLVKAYAEKEGSTVQEINLVNMTASSINTAISNLTGDADILFLPVTTGVDLSAAQVTALEVKLVAETGVTKQWEATNRSAAISTCLLAWNYFNTSSPPLIINYLGNLLSQLSDAEELNATYLAYAIVANHNSVTGSTITFDETNFRSLVGLLDKGIYTNGINDAQDSNPPAPIQDKFLLAIDETSGECVYDYLDVSDNLTAYPMTGATDITSFTLSAETETATIDATAHTVAITVANGTVVTALEPVVHVSTGGASSPDSGEATNFTSPVTYTVTADDGVTTQEWVVTVTVAEA